MLDQIPEPEVTRPKTRHRIAVEAMEKLLLIDDEADVQYSFRRIFDRRTCQLFTASVARRA
jgi:hypothetical protein